MFFSFGQNENTAIAHIQYPITTQVFVLVISHVTGDMVPVKAVITLNHLADRNHLYRQIKVVAATMTISKSNAWEF